MNYMRPSKTRTVVLKQHYSFVCFFIKWKAGSFSYLFSTVHSVSFVLWPLITFIFSITGFYNDYSMSWYDILCVFLFEVHWNLESTGYSFFCIHIFSLLFVKILIEQTCINMYIIYIIALRLEYVYVYSIYKCSFFFVL